MIISDFQVDLVSGEPASMSKLSLTIGEVNLTANQQANQFRTRLFLQATLDGINSSFSCPNRTDFPLLSPDLRLQGCLTTTSSPICHPVSRLSVTTDAPVSITLPIGKRVLSVDCLKPWIAAWNASGSADTFDVDQPIELQKSRLFVDDLRANSVYTVRWGDSKRQESPRPHEIVLLEETELDPTVAMVWTFPEARVPVRLHVKPIPFLYEGFISEESKKVSLNCCWCASTLNLENDIN